jgi:hypothetical protein
MHSPEELKARRDKALAEAVEISRREKGAMEALCTGIGPLFDQMDLPEYPAGKIVTSFSHLSDYAYRTRFKLLFADTSATFVEDPEAEGEYKLETKMSAGLVTPDGTFAMLEAKGRAWYREAYETLPTAAEIEKLQNDPAFYAGTQNGSLYLMYNIDKMPECALEKAEAAVSASLARLAEQVAAEEARQQQRAERVTRMESTLGEVLEQAARLKKTQAR